MGGHEYRPLPRFADLALPEDGRAVPGTPVHRQRRVLAHPLTGLWPPYSPEWASGRSETSPLSPWWRLRRCTAVGFAIVLYPGARAAEQAEIAERRRLLAAMTTTLTPTEEAHLRGGKREHRG